MKDTNVPPCGYDLSYEIVEGLCEGLDKLGKTNMENIPNALESMLDMHDKIEYPVLLLEMPPTRYGVCIAQVELLKNYSSPMICTRYCVDIYTDSVMQRRHRLEQLANAVIATILGETVPNFIDDFSPDETYNSINKNNHQICSMTLKIYDALERIAV